MKLKNCAFRFAKMSSDSPKKFYDKNFRVSQEYRDSLPDMQNEKAPEIGVPAATILQVGSANFKLPLKFAKKDGLEPILLEATISGTVSLDAAHKGINMSRIVRTTYEFQNEIFTVWTLQKIVEKLAAAVRSRRVQMRFEFNFPILQKSLRSELFGFQFYSCAYEGIFEDGKFRVFVEFDFVYSSACPCSAELSEHARCSRGILGIPHSQRSKARIFAEIVPEAEIFIEDFQKHCLDALHTETQVMVKREDEQAFAEMNGAYYKFVEDAVRSLYAEFFKDKRIADFRIVCAHLESLHSHDAVAVLNKGVPGGFSGGFSNFKSLIC